MLARSYLRTQALHTLLKPAGWKLTSHWKQVPSRPQPAAAPGKLHRQQPLQVQIQGSLIIPGI